MPCQVDPVTAHHGGLQSSAGTMESVCLSVFAFMSEQCPSRWFVLLEPRLVHCVLLVMCLLAPLQLLW
jgi:hypothetical protein